MRRVRFTILGIIVGIIAFASAGCMNAPPITQQQKQDVANRQATFSRAEHQVPAPSINTFPRRQTLADATARQSLPKHPWYVYLLGQNGNTIGYYVAKSVPVNDCDYLSSTENITNGTGNNTGDNNVITHAPSLEGIYQSASGCNTLTFFDLATNAEIQVTGLSTYVTDRPLRVDAQPIRVRGS